MLIDQAIFTSARTQRAEGYHLVATSPGVSPEEVRELAAWGPSHDSLAAHGAGAESLNLHELASSRFCVSQTVAAGNEYSDRGGRRIYTQCLLVPADLFARFANNPFAIRRAALAKGVMNVYETVPSTLVAIQLAGRSSHVDADLLKRVTTDVGPSAMGRLIQAVLSAPGSVGAAGTSDFDSLFAAVLNCLPVGYRTEVSFSTGLVYSPRRSFRLNALPGDLTAQRRLARQHDITVVDVENTSVENPVPRDGWAGYVAEMLAAEKFVALAAQIEQHAKASTSEELNQLGHRLLRDVDNAHTTGVKSPSRQPAQLLADSVQHAHAAHTRSDFSAAPAVAASPRATTITGPAQKLAPQSPAALELLGQLDDAVFDAISGSPAALEQLKTLWPRVLAEVGPELVAESKEQYLRYTLAVWGEAGHEALREPQQAATVLDVLCLLFEETNN